MDLSNSENAPTATPADSQDEDAGGPSGNVPPSQRVPRWGAVLLGLFLATVGLVLIYSVIVLWPAVQAGTKAATTTAAATAAAEPTTTKVTWFGWTTHPTPDTALILIVILVAALGSFLHAAVSFSDYVGNRRLAKSWVWWYLLRVIVGSGLALIFYFAIRGGFFASSAAPADVNPYGIAAISGLVGLFSKQATDKLREVFDTAFRVAPGYGDDARANNITVPQPVLTSSDPTAVPVSTLDVALVGSGFVETSIVQVAKGDGSAAKRDATLVSGERLAVKLEAADVTVAGALIFTVFNPPPGGGSSKPLEVEVFEAGEGNAPD